MLITIFFLVEYESYTWNPCSGDMCLAINCPGGLCESPSQQFFVKTLEEVKTIVDRNGTEHLKGMYRIEYDSINKKATVIELKLVPSFEVEVKDNSTNNFLKIGD